MFLSLVFCNAKRNHEKFANFDTSSEKRYFKKSIPSDKKEAECDIKHLRSQQERWRQENQFKASLGREFKISWGYMRPYLLKRERRRKGGRDCCS